MTDTKHIVYWTDPLDDSRLNNGFCEFGTDSELAEWLSSLLERRPAAVIRAYAVSGKHTLIRCGQTGQIDIDLYRYHEPSDVAKGI